jgi:hypothetical protein
MKVISLLDSELSLEEITKAKKLAQDFKLRKG